ncbi:MAG: bifunctional phosphoribosyl-AMP cyclohydrolase/phosphoribosyl-ATP diphosphatase HisIE [Longimicrobiales bacterium]
MDRNLRTANDLEGLEFWENGLLPVVTQDARSGEVLMVAFASREALERTLQTGEMVYWSRSRQELWHKGATSGNVQRLISLHSDCDGDALLARVHPLGPACHTGDRSCFGSLELSGASQGVEEGGAAPGGEAAPLSESTLPELWARLKHRGRERPGDSYTVRLLDDENLRLKKLGEEMVELILALALKEEKRIAEEGADLVYHLLAALLGSGVELDDLLRELEARKG